MSKRKRSWEGTDDFAAPEGRNNGFSIPQLLHPRSDASLTQPLDQNTAASAMQTSDVPQELEQHTHTAVRKFTACEACRKQKIRCDMPNHEPPCTRCHRRSLPCILNKNIHTLLEDTKKTDVLLRTDVANLHLTLESVCRHLNLEIPQSLLSKPISSTPVNAENGSALQSGDEPDCEVSPPLSPSAAQAPIHTFLEVAKFTSPGSGEQSLSSKRHGSHQDLVSKGVITIQVAERLLDRYFNRLDHYMYGIASVYKDASSVRQVSPILFAAICTVSALHEPSPDQSIYDACNREFRRLVARSVFVKTDLEYIRAMCIASFWLSDAARIFSSDAVRRAGDMRLQRFFRRAIHPNVGGSHAYPPLSKFQVEDRVRLWYLLFVCDQHMSILHNRDSLLRSDKDITMEWESFLERDGREDNDVRILSQTSLLLIMAQVRDTVGARPEEQLPLSAHGQLMMFSRQLDKWFSRFSAVFKPDPHIGGFPTKGLRLHYRFGKLNLGHHVFQGLHGQPVPDVFVPAALMAHDAAIAIFEMILNDEQLQSDLVGMPHYFHIMIAFAGHFLLEICSNYHAQLSLSLHDDLGLVSRVLTLFENLQCHPQHPIRRMTPGLGQKLFERAAKLEILLPFHQATSTAAGVANQNGDTATQQYQYPEMPDSFQLPVTQMHPMNEMGFAHFGEFEFPNMSLNFMA